jgi:hypothetical protein
LDGCWFRSAAISCALASCALVAGPGFAGIALAHAGLFGIDFFGDDDKSDMHHPRPGSETSAQSSPAAADEAPTAKIGSAPESDPVPQSAAMRSIASAPESVVIAQTIGGGGNGVPRVNTAGRATNLPRVSSAPVTRSVVIRRSPQAGTAGPADVPPAPRSPAMVALAAPPLESGDPQAKPPAGPPAPSTTAPPVANPLAPSGSGAARVPDSFRVGYAEYLRSADTGDLVVAALPGVVGITGFTLVGAYAGYRQARALQRALLAPAPTRILL